MSCLSVPAAGSLVRLVSLMLGSTTLVLVTLQQPLEVSTGEHHSKGWIMAGLRNRPKEDVFLETGATVN